MAAPFKLYNNNIVYLHLNKYASLNLFNKYGNYGNVLALDNILTGVANLDLGGNTRPLSVHKLFKLLTAHPVISSKHIVEAFNYSESHARRLALVLRVASCAFENHLLKREKDPNYCAHPLEGPMEQDDFDHTEIDDSVEYDCAHLYKGALEERQ